MRQLSLPIFTQSFVFQVDCHLEEIHQDSEKLTVFFKLQEMKHGAQLQDYKEEKTLPELDQNSSSHFIKHIERNKC